MSNQCEPSTEHNNGEEVDDSDTSSCGWSHLNIDGGDVQNELTTHFVMIGSALGEACSCDSVNIDQISVLSLVDCDERKSTSRQFAYVGKESPRCASTNNLAVARNYETLKALSARHKSHDLTRPKSSELRPTKIAHKEACQSLSVSSNSTASNASISVRSSKLSATNFSRKVRKLKAFKIPKKSPSGVLSKSHEEISLQSVGHEEEVNTHEEIKRDGDTIHREMDSTDTTSPNLIDEDPLCTSGLTMENLADMKCPLNVQLSDILEQKESSAFLELHKDVYENNLERLDEFWRKNKKRLNAALELFDPLGLNALHLACRLGRIEYLDLFLVLANTKFFKSRTRDPNALGWTVLDEAVILGNRKYIKLVYLMLQYHQQKRLKERESMIKKSLSQTIDFCITIRWLFKSWIPLLSRYLPSDTCVLYKKGNSVRLDSTLLNFSQNAWKRGKITVLYNPTKYGGENFVFIVPSQKQYSISSIDKPLKPNELSREVNSLLSNDVIVTKVSTRNMHYTPIKRLISRHRKIDKVGKYSASFYHWSGMNLKIFKRRDHLSAEQVHKNKSVLSDFYTGGVVPGMAGDNGGQRCRVPDLRPPDDPTGTFDDYLAHQVTVGRPMKIKNQTKSFKGCLAMSNQFPLSIEKLTEILELFSNFRLFNKLKNFLQRGLPPGFPVYIEMPVFPTVQGQITMEDFQLELPLSAREDFFYSVPEGFEQVDDLEVG
ncbi:ankyrin repeat domain-containing protein 13C-like isoform X3 [Convolutriloba macropyga]